MKKKRILVWVQSDWRMSERIYLQDYSFSRFCLCLPPPASALAARALKRGRVRRALSRKKNLNKTLKNHLFPFSHKPASLEFIFKVLICWLLLKIKSTHLKKIHPFMYEASITKICCSPLEYMIMQKSRLWKKCVTRITSVNYWTVWLKKRL